MLLDRLEQDASLGVRAGSDSGWEPKPGFGPGVLSLAAALTHYGLGPGLRAAVLSPASAEFLAAGVAVLLAGGTLVSLDPDLPEDELRRTLQASEAVHAFASDERQLARLIALRPELPRLELLILLTAEPSERKPPALTAEVAAAVGRDHLAESPGCLREAIQDSASAEACIFLDSERRLVNVSARALTRASQGIAEAVTAAPGKNVLSTLRLTKYEGFACAVGVLSRGGTVYVARHDVRPDSNLSQTPVDSIVLSEGSLRQLFQAWSDDLDAKSAPMRALSSWALQQGRSRQASPWKRRLADRVVLKKLRRRLGGRATQLNIVTPVRRDLPPEIKAFFESVGLSVKTHRLDGDSPLAR